jgi:hypothetical protein
VTKAHYTYYGKISFFKCTCLLNIHLFKVSTPMIRTSKLSQTMGTEIIGSEDKNCTGGSRHLQKCQKPFQSK